MTSVFQVTGSDPNPEARDVHNRSSASLQSAVWTISGKFQHLWETGSVRNVFNTHLWPFSFLGFIFLYLLKCLNNTMLMFYNISPNIKSSSWSSYLSCALTVRNQSSKGRISPQGPLKYQTITWLISTNLSSAAAVRSAGPEKTVPAVPGPHELHRRRSQDRHQGVPVPVQAEEVELQHRGQHIRVWTGHADRWVTSWIEEKESGI